ncbi:MAG: insulinase family protein [Gammaproteobacteria bacterium]|nr:insulinase family protein [Gammaproteobacteria bacterium]
MKSLVFLILSLVATGVIASPTIQHWETKRGVRVFFVATSELPIVDIQVVFDAGAARDGNHPGLALLTNALLPEGAGKLNADAIAEKLDDLGAKFNNSSHRDMSVYNIRSLSNPEQLNPAIDILATILSQPNFPDAAFDREKNRMLIGLQAKKQSPGAIAEESFFKAIYGNHPYSNMPSGNENSVKSLTRQNLVDFYNKYYVAKNTVISIVGDLSRSKAESLVKQLTGKLKNGQRADDLPQTNTPDHASLKKVNHPSTQSHILVGQPGIKRGDPDYFTLYVGNHILGGSGLNSRLSNEVREKRGLSYSTRSTFSPMRVQGPFQIGLQTQNSTTDEALSVLRATLDEFVSKGPTQKELDAAKKNITGGFALRISSNKKIMGYVSVIGFYGLPLDYLDTFNKHVQSVSLEQIKEAFKRRIFPEKMATVIVGGTS